MATANLTLAAVRLLTYLPTGSGSRWCIYWDRKLHGLGLRVTEANARSYVVRYRVRGSRVQHLKTVGSTAVLTVHQARDRAKEILRSAELGDDWFQSAARGRDKTLHNLWSYYEAHHLTESGVSARFRQDAAGMWTKHCVARFAKRTMASITPEQARDWHRQVTRRGPYIANRATQLLRAVWNYGAKFGQVPKGLANPFAAVTLNREQARKVILRPEDLPALAQAIEGVDNPWAKAYFWMLFYTGARRTEMMTLRWADVDLRAKTITFPQTKNGESQEIQLSAAAFEILQAIPRTNNPYVFAGDLERTHLHPKKPWERIRVDAGLPNLRMHDLRRSFGSWLGAIGYSSKQIGTLLGHKTDITSRVYIQLGEAVDLKRELTGAFANLAQEYRTDVSSRGKPSRAALGHRRGRRGATGMARQRKSIESPQIPHTRPEPAIGGA